MGANINAVMNCMDKYAGNILIILLVKYVDMLFEKALAVIRYPLIPKKINTAHAPNPFPKKDV